MDRSYSYNESEIELNNHSLETCLSVLLEKDTSLIYIENEEKKDIILKGVYKNLRKNTRITESKQEFLEELKQALNFSTIDEIPAKTYLLTIHDSLLLTKNSSEKVPNEQSTICSSSDKKELKFTNANLKQLTAALNKYYSSNIILNQNIDELSRYSFELENIAFTDLKTYLERNMGLSLLQYSPVDFPQDFDKMTIVTFKD